MLGLLDFFEDRLLSVYDFSLYYTANPELAASAMNNCYALSIIIIVRYASICRVVQATGCMFTEFS
jgi:hypothetical protein